MGSTPGMEGNKEMSNTVKIWSQRYSPARGNYMLEERECKEEEVQAWLKVFREDEPKVLFLASKRKPSI